MKPATGRRLATIAVATATGALSLQCTVAPPPPADTASPAPGKATVDPVTAAQLGVSWHPGCPVDPEELRLVGVNHIGFDNRTHRGELIVHEELVQQVIIIFGDLYRLRYPIAKMRTVDHYPAADDELSMEDNNTSAFSCRVIRGSQHWAQHAYGRAIDLNPVLNPFIDGGHVFQPENAAAYVDRSRAEPGLIHAGDATVRVFTDRGWRWGGNWKSPIDYQHFERR